MNNISKKSRKFQDLKKSHKIGIIIFLILAVGLLSFGFYKIVSNGSQVSEESTNQDQEVITPEDLEVDEDVVLVDFKNDYFGIEMSIPDTWDTLEGTYNEGDNKITFSENNEDLFEIIPFYGGHGFCFDDGTTPDVIETGQYLVNIDGEEVSLHSCVINGEVTSFFMIVEYNEDTKTGGFEIVGGTLSKADLDQVVISLNTMTLYENELSFLAPDEFTLQFEEDVYVQSLDHVGYGQDTVTSGLMNFYINADIFNQKSVQYQAEDFSWPVCVNYTATYSDGTFEDFGSSCYANGMFVLQNADILNFDNYDSFVLTIAPSYVGMFVDQSISFQKEFTFATNTEHDVNIDMNVWKEGVVQTTFEGITFELFDITEGKTLVGTYVTNEFGHVRILDTEADKKYRIEYEVPYGYQLSVMNSHDKYNVENIEFSWDENFTYVYDIYLEAKTE